MPAGVIVFAVFIAAPLLSRPSIRRLLGPPVRRAGAWTWARLNPEPEWDQDAHDLWMAWRRQQLCADVERLRRIVATDMAMSATRQIGNRLAYQQLLDDLEHTPDVYPAALDDGTLVGWGPSALTGILGRDSRRVSAVEVLEIGWRR